jgi:hypothetical protein
MKFSSLWERETDRSHLGFVDAFDRRIAIEPNALLREDLKKLSDDARDQAFESEGDFKPRACQALRLV